MAKKTANLNVRMDPDLLQSFRSLVAKHKYSTPLEVVRGWIEKYVDSGGRDDHLDYAILYQQNSELQKENKALRDSEKHD